MKRIIYFLVLALAISYYQCGSPNKSTEDNVVTVRLATDADRLNPPLTVSNSTLQILNNIFMPLQDFDPESLELKPVLAKTRPVIANIDSGEYKGGMSFTFEILEDAVWDNGKPVTADDYIFTLKTVLNPAVPATAWRSVIDFIRDVEKDPSNPRKFTVFSNQRYILAEEGCSNFRIMPEYQYDPKGILRNFTLKDLANAEKAAQLVTSDARLQEFAAAFTDPKFSQDPAFITGCGAYKLQSWTKDQELVLVKKDNWWGDAYAEKNPMLAAYPVKITYTVIANPATAIEVLKGGKADVMSLIPPQQFNELKKETDFASKFEFHTPDFQGFGYIGFNCKRAALSDKKVRRALAHLTNIEEIIQSVMYGLAKPTVGPFHVARDYYNKSLAPINYDTEKAKSLLTEAGWADSDKNGVLDKMIDGKKTELKLDLVVAANNTVGISIAKLLQESAQKVGVTINVLTTEAKVMMTENMPKRQFDLLMATAAVVNGNDDPKQFWHTTSDTPDGNNRFGFGNAESDALIDQIRVTLDKKQRDALYLKFQEIVYDEQPAIFLFCPKERIVIAKKFDAKTYFKRPGYFENMFTVK